MAMIYFEGNPVELNTPVGNPGGQAVVYRLNERQVVKVFNTKSEDQSRRLKWAIDQQIYFGFGRIAAVPKRLVYSDPSENQIAGYVMPFLDGYIPLIEILDSPAQIQHKVDLQLLTQVFKILHASVKYCHEMSFVVGDLNANNIMIKLGRDQDLSVMLIDTDSWGYAGFNNSWLPAAIDRDIEHQELSLKDLSEGKMRTTLLNRDWYAYTLHLAHALCGRHPFATGRTAGRLTVAERKAKYMTLWHYQVRTTHEDMIWALRLGAKMRFLLRNWLNADASGEFPLDALTHEFAGNLTTCPGMVLSPVIGKRIPCKLEAHRSVLLCPQCMGPL